MLSVVLPCYNEADNLQALCERLDRLAEAVTDLEIILVDNGSTDATAAIFADLLAANGREKFRVVTVEKNIGYGFGILTGLRAAKGEILAVTHADRQTDPMDVVKALDLYGQANDPYTMVKGFRKNRKLTEAFFSWGMGMLATLVLGIRLTEINAQPKLFSRKFFEEIQLNAPNDFALDLYFLFQARKRGRVVEFPVFFAKRVAGEAKGGSGSSWKTRWKLVKRCGSYIFDLRDKLK